MFGWRSSDLYLVHLHAGIRLAALRRMISVDLYEGVYGMYRQELMDPASTLRSFKPEVILIALDAHHLAEAEGANPEAILAVLRACSSAAESSRSTVIQQTIFPVFPHL
jgi:predicted enzyme involved in methoxymalonyl-ACP biosynthesis